MNSTFMKDLARVSICEQLVIEFPHNLVSCRVEINGEVTLVNSTINSGCDFLQESNSFDEVPNVMLPFVYLIRTAPIQTTVHFLVNVLLFVDVVSFVYLKRIKRRRRKESTIRRMLIQYSQTCTKQRPQHNHESFLVEQSLGVIGVCQQNHMRTPKLLAT